MAGVVTGVVTEAAEIDWETSIGRARIASYTIHPSYYKKNLREYALVLTASRGKGTFHNNLVIHSGERNDPS